MKAYKGFDKDLKCRDFQYEIGKEYEEEEAKVCEKGFHACTNPLSVLRYYSPCYENRYCEVEQDGELSENSDDFKVASTKIKIGDEIGLIGLVQAAIENSCKSGVESINRGRYTVAMNIYHHSVASNGGYGSTAVNTGACSVASTKDSSSIAANTGDYSVAWTQKNYSIAANTGNYSAVINKGYHSIAANTGERSITASNGVNSVAVNTGYQSATINNAAESVALNTGACAEASVTQEGSIAIAVGAQSRAKATLGSAIVLVERTTWNGHTYPLNNIKAAIVDGEKIKADTWYTLRNGEFVEA